MCSHDCFAFPCSQVVLITRNIHIHAHAHIYTYTNAQGVTALVKSGGIEGRPRQHVYDLGPCANAHAVSVVCRVSFSEITPCLIFGVMCMIWGPVPMHTQWVLYVVFHFRKSPHVLFLELCVWSGALCQCTRSECCMSCFIFGKSPHVLFLELCVWFRPCANACANAHAVSVVCRVLSWEIIPIFR